MSMDYSPWYHKESDTTEWVAVSLFKVNWYCNWWDDSGLNIWIDVSEVLVKFGIVQVLLLFLIPNLKKKASNEGFYKKALQSWTLGVISDGPFRSDMLYKFRVLIGSLCGK